MAFSGDLLHPGRRGWTDGGGYPMRTPVFELHILPLFRATDREHMSFAFDLWDYDQVADHADEILGRVEFESMPTSDTGGPWPQEWIQLFRRWNETGRKRLQLGTAQYTFTPGDTKVVEATGTFPAAGFRGWLQIETETSTSRTFVLYFEPPDAPVAGSPETFALTEFYSGSDTQSVFVHDSTGVQQIR
jgi:hypothetical protein